ncbi:MAG TPA: hypothetical protein VL463_05485 [Kofleriaceae bacterium]|nr:hypothetical protein [Kofleriaceae bacterium]
MKIATCVLALAGCASNLAEGTRATGEALSVDDLGGLRQGRAPIDEQDFYRIAGDREAEDEIAAYRNHGVVENRIGLVLALIGTAAIVSFATDEEHRDLSVPLMLTLPIGGITAFIGSDRTSKENLEGFARANEAADRYNAHLSTMGAAP